MQINKQLILLTILLTIAFFKSIAQTDSTVNKNLIGLDEKITKIMADWKAVGCAVGIVKNGKVIYTKGFGYRDLYKKLPVTPQTLFPIGSNTKLFTATAIGLLVNDKKIEWDKPIKQLIPEIEFNSDILNNNVTIRDMLSHRTGIASPDFLWFGYDYTQKEIFNKIKFIKSDVGFREAMIYNNFMYIASGQIIELISKKTYEEFVTEKLFIPLNMKSSIFSIGQMTKAPDYSKAYHSDFINNKIDSIDYFRGNSLSACGGIISNINDLSNWLICQLANGNFNKTEIIPLAIFEETMKPNIVDLGVYPNNLNDKNRFYSLYAMGRDITTYKGHAMTYHDGAITGFVSRIVAFPNDSLGIIILTNSTGQNITNYLAYEIADRVLNLERTNWHENVFDKIKKNREKNKIAEKELKSNKVLNTSPSHRLVDYTGEYENELYGKIIIKILNNKLNLILGKYNLLLDHYHYDQFDTHDQVVSNPNFSADNNGKVTKVIINLNGQMTTFIKNK